MIDQLMILAESGGIASEGITPPVVGIGVFLILMTLLGFTWLTGGKHQRSKDRKKREKTTGSDD